MDVVISGLPAVHIRMIFFIQLLQVCAVVGRCAGEGAGCIEEDVMSIVL
jgi:hypothetical protein